MMLVFVFAIIGVILELILPTLPKKYELTRLVLGSTGIGLLVTLSVYLMVYHPNASIYLLSFLSFYRVINLLRIIKSRVHPEHLLRNSLYTTCWLVSVQISVIVLARLFERHAVPNWLIWVVVCIVQSIVTFMMLQTIRSHARKASEILPDHSYSERELPSVTVAIAARNETDELTNCVRSLLASDYPKLEILVLDDCSQTRRTPEIIRGFAHAGVRFVPGDEPGAGWLARNQAYNTLARAASGSYILYCSTSVRVEPDSIRKLVSYAVAHQKKMLSIMPRYQVNGANQLRDARWTIIQSMRTAWELMLPRQMLSRPPVMNTCWLIQAAALRSAGGFVGVSRMITPEAHFARTFFMSDEYAFLSSGETYGVVSQKSPDDQLATAIRVSYPSLHRRPEMVAFTSFCMTVFGLLPFASSLYFLWNVDHLIVSTMSLIVSTVLLITYRQVVILTYGSASLVRIFTFPLGVLTVIALHNYSMYKYEFSEVLWKDRNICLPAMYITPHLPAD